MLRKIVVYITIIAVFLVLSNKQVVGSEVFSDSNKALIQAQEKVRNKNPQLGAQIQQMIENQEKVGVRVEQKMARLEEKSAFLKFLYGPNYEKVGEVEKEIVQLKNQLQQMEVLKSKVSSVGEGELVIMDQAIESMEDEILELESDLNAQVSEFSLFGWLNKFLNYQEETV